MQAQIDGAQAELDANLAALRGSGDDSGLIARGDAQIGALSALHRELASASPMALAMMRAVVAATVAASSSLGQQARTAAASTPQTGGATPLAAASAQARNAVQSFERDMFERRVFDPYLKFASAEDEEAYRKREAERHAAIDKAMAKGTPQGVLEANELSIQQMKDAGAHGADRSPIYASRLDTLEGTKANLQQAAEANAPKQGAEDRLAIADAAADNHACKVALPSDLVAKMQKSGITTTHASVEGHGVTANAVIACLDNLRG